jgi:hypothetical protein
MTVGVGVRVENSDVRGDPGGGTFARMPTRREFVTRCLGAAWLAVPRQPQPHPAPRPGVTGARVLTRAQLGETPALAPLFDQVRAIPAVVDGIRCNCGCAELPGYYSLLSCFEGDAMARHCAVCQGQARLAARLHREGRTLDQIRDAVDARFG